MINKSLMDRVLVLLHQAIKIFEVGEQLANIILAGMFHITNKDGFVLFVEYFVADFAFEEGLCRFLSSFTQEFIAGYLASFFLLRSKS